MMRTGAILTREKPSTSRLNPTNMVSNGPSSDNNRSTQSSSATSRMLNAGDRNAIGSRAIAASKVMPSNKGKSAISSSTLNNSGRSATIRDNVETSKHETRRSSTAN